MMIQIFLTKGKALKTVENTESHCAEYPLHTPENFQLKNEFFTPNESNISHKVSLQHVLALSQIKSSMIMNLHTYNTWMW